MVPNVTKILAIVPTYSRPDLVGETVASILAQHRRPDRIVVAEDGGDTVLNRVALSSYLDQIEMVWRPNAGKSATLNNIISTASEDLIWIVDDDDIAVPKALAELEAALMAQPDAMFSYGKYDHLVKEEDIWILKPCRLPSPSDEELNLAILESCFILQPGMLVKRAAYSEVGMFDTAYPRGQDYEMLLRLGRRYSAARVDSIVFHQRQHAGLRGPSYATISAAGRSKAWLDADRRIFATVLNDYSLGEFLPARGLVATGQLEVQARINRAAILARKGMWVEASRDLAAAANHAASADTGVKVAIFSRVVGGYDLPSKAEIETFVSALNMLPATVSNEIRKRLGASLPAWARSSMRNGDWSRLSRALAMMKSIGFTYVFKGFWRYRNSG